MVTPPKLVSAIWILIGLLPVGCPGEDPQDSSCGGGYGDFSQVMPKNWSVISQDLVDVTGTGEVQCAVLYRADVSPSNQHTPPVAGVVYGKDRGEPPNIYAYPLNLPEGFYLGEHQVTVSAAKVLSGTKYQELVIQDTTPENIIVEASIFSWEPGEKAEESRFQLRGWFRAEDGVFVETDRVTIRERLKDTRSQLVYRRVYRSTADKSYFKKGSQNLVDPETEMVSLAMPDDPTTARFPEKTVLAFYKNITDLNALTELLTQRALTALLNNQLRFGCAGIDRSQLERAWIEDIDWPRNGEIKPEVTVKKGKCRLKNGSVKEFTAINWQLERSEGRWWLTGTK